MTCSKQFTDELLANSWFTNFAIKRCMIETDGLSLADALAHEHYRYPRQCAGSSGAHCPAFVAPDSSANRECSRDEGRKRCHW